MKAKKPIKISKPHPWAVSAARWLLERPPAICAVQEPDGWKVVVSFKKYPLDHHEVAIPLDEAICLLGQMRRTEAGWESARQRALQLHKAGYELKTIARWCDAPDETVEEWIRDQRFLHNVLAAIGENPESREGSL